MSQTSYAEQAVGIAGMQGDNTQGQQKSTAINVEAAAEIAFGYMVMRFAAASGVNPPGAKITSAAGDDLLGVVMHSHEYDKRLDLGTVGVLPKRQLNVMQQGRVWVMVDVAVAVTDTVYVRYTTNGAALAGTFTNSADTAKARIVYGAKFLTATTGAGLVLLELDIGAHRSH